MLLALATRHFIAAVYFLDWGVALGTRPKFVFSSISVFHEIKLRLTTSLMPQFSAFETRSIRAGCTHDSMTFAAAWFMD